MFQYEYEKRPKSARSDDSATETSDWSRAYPTSERTGNTERARRPLPPRPVIRETNPGNTAVPLKIWIIASASCFAVCGALVLATVVITKWGTGERYTTHELYAQPPEPIYSPYPEPVPRRETETEADPENSEESKDDIDVHLLEKLAIFKNYVANRDKKNLVAKLQYHPLHDQEFAQHAERKIEKKDRPKFPENPMENNLNHKNIILKRVHQDMPTLDEDNPKLGQHGANFGQRSGILGQLSPILGQHHPTSDHKGDIPEFKPTLPDIFGHGPDRHIYQDSEFEDYYNDENLYQDYIHSNTMTSYLIEKVQELHDWVTGDPDFKAISKNNNMTNHNFGQVLKALNESLLEGNVTIVISKLKDVYFGDNFTQTNGPKKVIGNNTDLISFGILTLDIMLLHNIQQMAWENQEAVRNRMLRDPNVFAFNALFLDPTKVEAKQNEINRYDSAVLYKRTNQRQESAEEFDFSKNLLENIMEVGLSTARAAIHLGRAYKNTRTIINQLASTNQNRDTINANIQSQLSRNVDGNTQALSHLQSISTGNSTCTHLDCVWLVYCRNLVATSELNAPYSTMARLNGMALRLLTGELAPGKALDTMLYELFTGWTDLKCNDIFPKCAKMDAAAIVLENILPVKKSQAGPA